MPAEKTSSKTSEETSPDALSKEDRRLALLLGVPGFALGLCLATLSTYLPVLARKFTSSSSVIGLLVGGEGLIAVLLPVWIGRLSDGTRTRLGPRLPFLVATAPVAAVAIALLPFAPSLPVLAVEVFAFYVAYFTYFSPYRALYPDLIPDSANARAQGIQGVFNSAGLGCALVGGGFLLAVWQPLLYLIAAAVMLLATAFLVVVLRSRGDRPGARPSAPGSEPGSSSPFGDLWSLIRDHRAVLRFVLGNSLLTLALGGLKSFVVLWLTEGLGKSMTFTGGAMTVVAAGTVVGALLSGRLGDKLGPGRVLCAALCVFGGGVAIGTFTTSVLVLGIAFPFIALAGGAAIALPYAFLLKLTPSAKHGLVAGLFDASSGLGTLLGPTLTGLAIDALRSYFPASHGYSAMWPVLSVASLGATACLWGVRDGEDGGDDRGADGARAARA